MAKGFDKLIKDFEEEILKEGLFGEVEKHKIAKFIGLNKNRVKAAIKLYKELAAAKNSGHYGHAKSPLIVAAEVTNLKPRILAYELGNQGLVNETVLREYLDTTQEGPESKVASLEDFVTDVYTSGEGTVTFKVLDNGEVEYSIGIQEEDNDADGRYATMKTKPDGYLKGQRFVG